MDIASNDKMKSNDDKEENLANLKEEIGHEEFNFIGELIADVVFENAKMQANIVATKLEHGCNTEKQLGRIRRYFFLSRGYWVLNTRITSVKTLRLLRRTYKVDRD